MDDLWLEFDQIQVEKAVLNRREAKVIKQIRKVPSERDLKICMEYLNDRKESDIAAERGITQQAVSAIVKKCMPPIAGSMRRYGP